MRDPDVLVVGGGVVGLFCAYFLRRAGGTVTVVERGEVGGPLSCSAGNTGFVGTHGAAPLAEPWMFRTLLSRDGPLYVRPRLDGDLLRWLGHLRRASTPAAVRAAFPVLLELKRRSAGILRELHAAGELGTTFAAPGMIVAYRDPRAFDRACRAVPAATGRGVPLRVLDPAEVAELEPDVRLEVCGALYNEEGAWLRLPDFLVEFAGLLTRQGVELRPGTEVLAVETAGRQVRRVRTSRGDFRPERVVLAAGAWSAGLARTLGVELALQPVRGVAVTVEAPGPRRPVALGEARMAVAPLGGRVRVGGLRELTGLDRDPPRARADALVRTAADYLPHLRGAARAEVWSGQRPCTPDSLPYLGPAGRYDNLYLACGGGHIGMGLAPAGARLLAQLVAGERPDTDPAPFRVGRHSGGGSRGT